MEPRTCEIEIMCCLNSTDIRNVIPHILYHRHLKP